jgi:hypothetical protein
MKIFLLALFIVCLTLTVGTTAGHYLTDFVLTLL